MKILASYDWIFVLVTWTKVDKTAVSLWLHLNFLEIIKIKCCSQYPCWDQLTKRSSGHWFMSTLEATLQKWEEKEGGGREMLRLTSGISLRAFLLGWGEGSKRGGQAVMEKMAKNILPLLRKATETAPGPWIFSKFKLGQWKELLEYTEKWVRE